MTDLTPLLLTASLLTACDTVRRAILGDWDSELKEITARVCASVLDIAEAADTHVRVPNQGIGTFVVEAKLGTMVPHDGWVFIFANDAYGQRVVQTGKVIGQE
jgi:2-aminoethylphosphonate-pyruvate transaminase